MRLSDLIGLAVVDERGERVGKVHDVRLQQDGPIIGGFGARLRVTGLIVGTRAVGARLGYGRGVRGPWLLRALAGKGGKLVPYERISAIEADRVLISGTGDDLPAPNDAPAAAPPGG